MPPVAALYKAKTSLPAGAAGWRNAIGSSSPARKGCERPVLSAAAFLRLMFSTVGWGMQVGCGAARQAPCPLLLLPAQRQSESRQVLGWRCDLLAAPCWPGLSYQLFSET